MKACCLFLCLLLAAGSAFATSVGDTYEQVIKEKGNPRSQINAGARRLLQYPDATLELRDNVVTSIKAAPASPPAEKPPAMAAPGSPAAENSAAKAPAVPANPKIASLQRDRERAVVRVKQIVNQPVPPIARTPQMRVGTYPYWFHEGAETPDFDKVDIRQTQGGDYARFPYVASDLNPGIVYPGNALEFNSMTKFFYVDRSVPKKKLTEDEMLEINNLYRVIGRCDKQLEQLSAPTSPSASTKG